MAKTNNEIIAEYNKRLENIITIVKNNAIDQELEINANGPYDVRRCKTVYVNITPEIQVENIDTSNINIIKCDCLNRKALNRNYNLPSDTEIDLAYSYFKYWSKIHMGE